MAGCPLFRGQQIMGRQPAAKLPCGSGAAIKKRNVFAQDGSDLAFQKRVVRAAQYDCIYLTAVGADEALQQNV